MSASMIEENTFEVSAPARLVVSNLRGRVDIRSGEPGAIHISTVMHPDDGDERHTSIDLHQEEDGSVEAHTLFPRNKWDLLHFSRPCRVDYLITAPTECSIKVNVVSSEVHIEQFSGEFHISTVSGKVSLNALTGPLRLHTTSGQVKATSIQGDLFMDAVSGDVHFDTSNLPSIKAETVSGKLDFQTALGQGPYYCGSVSGAIRLRLPADTVFSIDLDSVSGRVSSTLPITRQARMNRAHLVDVQGGGVLFRMRSVSGCLVIEPG